MNCSSGGIDGDNLKDDSLANEAKSGSATGCLDQTKNSSANLEPNDSISETKVDSLLNKSTLIQENPPSNPSEKVLLDISLTGDKSRQGPKKSAKIKPNKNVSSSKQAKGKKKVKVTFDDSSENSKERHSALEAKVRYQVSCEEKAFRIVERLLDNPVTEEVLVDVARFISPSHYDDIIEERSIAGNCGYPLCAKMLGKVPQQKYKISLKEKKVYDISDRKKFCSNECYKASQHYKQQIPDSAVWSRKEEPPPRIHLLASHDNKGSAGEIVPLDTPTLSVKKHLEQIETKSSTDDLQQRNISDDRLVEGVSQIQIKDKQDNTEPSDNSTDNSKDQSGQHSLDSGENQPGKLSKDGKVQLGQHSPDSDKNQPEQHSQDIKDQLGQHSPDSDKNQPGQHSRDIKDQQRQHSPDNDKNQPGIHSKDTKDQSGQHSQDIKDQLGQHSPDSDKNQPGQHSQDRSKDQAGPSRILMKLLDKRDELLLQKSKTELGQRYSNQKRDVVEIKTSKMEYDQNRDCQAPQTPISSTSSGTIDEYSTALSKSAVKSEDGCTDVIGKAKRTSSAQVLENARRFQAQKDALAGSKEVGQQNEPLTSSKKSKHSGAKQDTSVTSNVLLERLRRTLLDWQTHKTVQYLCREEKDTVNQSSREKFSRQYAALERKVDKMMALEDMDEMVGATQDDLESHTAPEGKIPSYKNLGEESHQFQVKVHEFYGAKTLDSDDDEDQSVNIGKSAKKNKENDEYAHFTPQLPPVDSLAQLTLRRRIVMDRLDKVLPDLLGPLKLSMREISTEVRDLVYTFNLNSHNVILRPREWTLMGYVLLSLLAVRVAPLSQALNRKSAITFFSTMMGGAGITQDNIQELLDLILNTEELD